MAIERGSLLRRLWRRRVDLPLVAEAVCRLTTARLRLKRQPFQQIAQRLIGPVEAQKASASAFFPRRVRWAVLAAARRVPWRSVCFDQAIAAQQMLGRRGIVADLVYGVRQSEAGLDAHVWLRLADGWIVVGGEQAPLFHPIALFRPGREDVSLSSMT
ncbi:lasso peptide biosynthesis B2 protein [Bradyrhizobium sp. OK095]|jgi:hypothetical protein|uniref:lasso peptide biosynthesis B2 protein n=1 Tax=Bradyrhizobium sp. OK095 TaxID=1882760 RepID=UPI0008D21C65|nr:lasso peptide biosynthesis B2 protein [Bradyrhizobium sp. OK095]SEN76554.1 Transglutaminase-like superfamily protein [Bradyrhizobium sp. OK095]